MTGSGNVEQDWINMLMASPLFQQINDLQEMLDKSTGGAASDVVIGEQKCHSCKNVMHVNGLESHWLTLFRHTKCIR